ncbi:cation:proton antiporter [Thalassomonas actiniarum]|uniref:Cation:proton antiporter n=1 Tax=Thalassomonas actiniarum TaxID=485447 RepID=A0AAE9YVK6_9GAMM|nr:cation:proton antiporter [Thalassomonas actiniarum]WDE01134.1 cation:proton antiporter [Thalassomonas actiniarum]
MASFPLLTILLALAVCFLLAEFIADKIKINKPLSYLLVGFVVSELFTRNGTDILLRADNFSTLTFQGILPLILFEMTLSMVKAHRVELAKCAGLSVYLFAVFVPVASVIVYFLMDRPFYFPPMAALLSIAVIAAVEPACSRLSFTRVKLSNPIRSQIEVETVISDALAAVLFSFVLLYVTSGLDTNELGGNLIFAFLKLVFGGLLLGAALGYLSTFVIKICRSVPSYLVLTFTLAYGSYFLAEAVLGASGVVAVLAAGLVFRVKLAKAPSFKSIKNSWHTIGYFADAWLFLLLGMTFTIEMFTERYLAMLILIFALIAGKCIAGISGYWLFKPYRGEVAARPMANSIVLGNYNGALAVALVLSLPVELSYWWTTQAMVFGVVLYSLVIQLPLFNFINRLYK